MLEFYKVRHLVVDRNTGDTLDCETEWNYICVEERPENKHIILTWDNIGDFVAKTKQISILHSPELVKRRKGLMAIIGTWWNKIYYFKQWKRPELNLEYVVEYSLVKLSIQDVIEYHNGELAIKYLMERGIKYLRK